MNIFKNRNSAGRLLAARLSKHTRQEAIVLAVPRGGVPVGYEIAAQLKLPLDIAFTKKLRHPDHREYAIGAASLTDYFVLPHLGVSTYYVKTELRQVRDRLREMHRKYLGNRPSKPLNGKTIILVDDGAATGNTLLSTVNVLRNSHPDRIIAALPVASEDAVDRLRKVVDELVTLVVPNPFQHVGAFYEDFTQITDQEVKSYLQKMSMSRQLNKAI